MELCLMIIILSNKTNKKYDKWSFFEEHFYLLERMLISSLTTLEKGVKYRVYILKVTLSRIILIQKI